MTDAPLPLDRQAALGVIESTPQVRNVVDTDELPSPLNAFVSPGGAARVIEVPKIKPPSPEELQKVQPAHAAEPMAPRPVPRGVFGRNQQVAHPGGYGLSVQRGAEAPPEPPVARRNSYSLLRPWGVGRPGVGKNPVYTARPGIAVPQPQFAGQRRMVPGVHLGRLRPNRTAMKTQQARGTVQIHFPRHPAEIGAKGPFSKGFRRAVAYHTPPKIGAKGQEAAPAPTGRKKPVPQQHLNLG